MFILFERWQHDSEIFFIRYERWQHYKKLFFIKFERWQHYTELFFIQFERWQQFNKLFFIRFERWQHNNEVIFHKILSSSIIQYWVFFHTIRKVAALGYTELFFIQFKKVAGIKLSCWSYDSKGDKR